ncbi:ATP-binding protein [Clostridium estertheticum]|uniref:ATP-binding protein n=1 Tax=Clostridium estertheticum TaxID=238834 RepID=A0A5N7J1G2_9CLOT|nr:ATP-binding protein [Clostridium estertheticum]MPQ31865.1 ATP-binding protein [Clostridium estertheticum]MPQ62532.1 ATP-binding protein [Clostridium estertheticum]
MKITTGQAARGDNFFKRPILINKLWRKIDSDSSIIISAPRRVGKTSLMRYIEDNPREKYYVVYVITESVYNENKYYKEIVKAILNCDSIRKRDKVINSIKDIAKNIFKSIDEVGIDSVKFSKNIEYNYYDKFIEIMRSIDLEGHKLIIMIDEFAQTIENIQQKEGTAYAVHLLQSNRVLRQNSDINNKFQFIYTGSISLEGIARRMDSSKFINDLDIVKVTPLSESEGKNLINALLKGLDFTMDEGTINHMLNEIKWLIPFYIQLAMDKIQDIYDEDNLCVIHNKSVDIAIKRMIEENNKFSSWHERLVVYKNNDYKFIIETLDQISISEAKKITYNETHNLAVKYNLCETYKDLLNTLTDDGYINNDDERKFYTFTSPILRMWWCKKNAN